MFQNNINAVMAQGPTNPLNGGQIVVRTFQASCCSWQFGMAQRRGAGRIREVEGLRVLSAQIMESAPRKAGKNQLVWRAACDQRQDLLLASRENGSFPFLATLP